MNLTHKLGSFKDRPEVYEAYLTDTTSVPDGNGGQITDDRGIVVLTDSQGRQFFATITDLEGQFTPVGDTVDAPSHPSEAAPEIAAGAPTTYPASEAGQAPAVQGQAPVAPTSPLMSNAQPVQGGPTLSADGSPVSPLLANAQPLQ